MTHDDDPVPRDAWLNEALRHAPDADAAPSPRLDAAVLRMGRAAVAPRMPRAAPPPPSWLDHLGAAWRWLAQPPVAAGFASVMVATVVGLMWWGRPLDEALPPRDAAVVAASEAPQATPVATASAPVANAAQAPRADQRAAESSRRAAPAAAPPALAKSTAPPAITAVAPERRRDAAADATKAAAAGAAPVAPPPAPAPEPARMGGLLEQRSLTAPKADARRETDVGAARAPAQAPVAAAAAPLADAAPPPTAALRAAAPASAEFIATPGLSNLRFEIRAKPQGWTWQRDGGEARAVDDALQGWIAQADRTARPRWLAGGADGEAATTLRFLRDGQVRAVLRLRAGGLRIDRGGKVESADLSAGQVAALRSALDALGP